MRKSALRWLCVILTMIFWSGVKPIHAQTGGYSYGSPGAREGGSVVCANFLNGNVLIAGYRNDSTLIIEIDPSGNLLREVTFKVTPQGHEDWVTDFKFDQSVPPALIGCGFDAIPGMARFGGYVFKFDPVLFVPIWTTSIPNDGGDDFAPYSILDPGAGANYDLYGSSYPNINGAVSSVNRVNGAWAGMTDWALNSAEDFAATVRALGSADVFSTGRWSWTASAADFRPGLARLTTPNVIADRTYMVNFNSGVINARLYPTDVELFQFNDRPVTVGGGDFNGTSTGANTEVFWSRHDPTNCMQLTGMRLPIPSLNSQYAQEVIPTNPALGSQPNWVIMGQGLDPNTLQRRIWVMEVSEPNPVLPAGSFNWGNYYGDVLNPGEHYFLHHQCQQQIIRHANSVGVDYYVFTGTRINAATGSEELWVCFINTNGTLDPGDDAGTDPCLVSFQLTPVAQVADDDPALIMGQPQLAYPDIPWVANDPNLPEEVVCGNTCFAATDTNYIHVNNPAGTPFTYNSGNTPSGTAVWAGKIYVDANITVDGVTLDITNTDVVFAPCTGITFINGANLRANNSTFRPCNEDDSWRGIDFNSNSTGLINECVFKNAYEAVRLNSGNLAYDVRITNNLFADCLTGVSLPQGGTSLSEGITGNTFTVDTRTINWNDDLCNPLAGVVNYFGISSLNATFAGQVSQNDFINTSEGGVNLTGIFWRTSTGKISLNHFTNNQTAIRLSDCIQVAVENNQCELTQLFAGGQNQIWLERGEFIWVMQNEINNSTETDIFTLNGAAISATRSILINVKENRIDGFGNGIQFIEVERSQIALNRIDQANIVAIYVEDGVENIVSCNEIKMRLRPFDAPACAGIEYIHNSPVDPTLTIKSNCINDATYAILLFNFNATTFRIPVLHNNYMYNYTKYGISSTNFTGSIGNALFPPEQAGRNSYISNNIVYGAIDLATSGPAIVSWGDWGINTISAGITLNGNGMYNSITACGNQIGTVTSTLTDQELCDTYFSNMDGSMVRLMNGDYSEFEVENYLSDKGQVAGAFLRRLVVTNKLNAAASFDNWIAGSNAFTAGEKTFAHYQYLTVLNDYSNALSLLPALVSTEPALADFASVEEITAAILLSNRGISQLAAAEKATLTQLDNERGTYADHARELLALGTHQYAPVLRPVMIPEVDMKSMQTLDVSQDAIHLFPNPANTSVTVQFAAVSNAQMLRVFDAQGRLVADQALDSNAAEVNLDIAAWSPGIYLITLLDANGASQTAKLLVQ